jgi:hypothetical protein
MRIINPDALPSFWWAFPWTIARDLHKAAVALKAYADRADRIVDIQSDLILQQSDEIRVLRNQVDRLDAAIMTGRAINPDAQPVPEDLAR